MIRAAGLYRASSKRQVANKYAGEVDLPAQRKAVGDFIKAQGWSLTEEYVELGISAYKKPLEKRPELLRALKEASERKFDKLVIFLGDRLSRQGPPYITLLDQFRGYGVEVWSAMEKKHLSLEDMELVMRSFEAAQNRMESKKTSIRVGARLRQMVEGGRRIGGHCPYGYKLVPVLDVNGQVVERAGRVVRDMVPSEFAPVVEEIFRRYIHGQGSAGIAHWLNASGVESVTGRGWTPGGIRVLLSNPNYAGLMRCEFLYEQIGNTIPNVVEGQHQPIVTREVWEMARGVMAEKAKLPPRQRAMTYPLAGVARCAHCGGPMGGTTHHRTRKSGRLVVYRWYRCLRWAAKGSCQLTNVDADKIEENFVKVLESMTLPEDPENLRALYEERERGTQNQTQKDEAERKLLRDELRKTEVALTRLDKAFLEDGVYTSAEYRTIKGEYAKKREDAEKRLGQLSGTPKESNADEKVAGLTRYALNLRTIWQRATPEQRKILAMSFAKGHGAKVLVHKGGAVTVEWA